MTFEPLGIPLAALVIAIATLVYTAITHRQMATNAYTEQLEKRIGLLEAQLLKAIDENAALRSENLDLLQRLFHATGGRREIPQS